MGEILDVVRNALDSGTPLALCTVVQGPGTGAKMAVPEDPEIPVLGDLGDPDLTRVVARDARGLLSQGLTELRQYGPKGEARLADVQVFVESFSPPPRLIVFGAIDFTRALCQVGKVLGYTVTVCDPRAVFATRARFPEADEVVVSWADDYLRDTRVDERTVVCVLTHDPKMDVPALVAAVETPAAYIGAMGSRRTHATRLERLREAGMSEEQISRIAAPIGLDIGARTPEESAISVFGEVIATRTGRDGGRLTGGAGPIHAR